MKTIHCIGDSHSCFFYGQDKIIFSSEKNDSLIPCFKVYNIGPSLAYNLCTSGTTTGGREKILDMLENKILHGSRILLCFGEIDCRCHILKQAEEQKKDVETVVEGCVKRYFDFIKEIKAKGYEVLVWAVIPTAPDSTPIDYDYPRLGTCAERNSLTRCFNEKLKNLSAGESIKFISFFEQLVDSKNITKEQFYMDQIHVSQDIMPAVIEELRKNFNDIPVIKLPDLTRIYIGGKAAKKGWKILNVNKAPYVDYVADYCDLSVIESNSVDEIYACHLQRLDHREEVIAALNEIYRVLKPSAIFRSSVPDLQILCRLFLHPDSSPQQQFDTMKLIFGSHTGKTEFNNVGFNEVILSEYLKNSGLSNPRRVPEFKMFKEQSSVFAFGRDIMLNVEAVK